MKRAILIFVLFFISGILFAQNWLLGGDLLFTHDRTSPDITESPDFTRFTLELYFGRYVLKDFAFGVEFGYYCVNLTKTSTKFGPFFEYDFLKLPILSLGLRSSLDYHIYTNSIQDNFSGKSVDVNVNLLLNFFITKNIAIFTQLLGAYFQYQWWEDTVLGTTTNYSRTIFDIALNDLRIGLKFKF
ncbi:MAG: hypothetical protein FWH35_04605 [Treponema sp.]|nr:hypothetical protein [Treponema sp.]